MKYAALFLSLFLAADVHAQSAVEAPASGLSGLLKRSVEKEERDRASRTVGRSIAARKSARAARRVFFVSLCS